MSAKTSRTSAAQTRARLKAARASVATDEDDQRVGGDGISEPGLSVSLPDSSGTPTPIGLPEPHHEPPTPMPTATRLPQPAPASRETVSGGQHQKGTGIDVSADLVERVQREARARSRGGRVITQTEIVLGAFESVYERLPVLVARRQAQQQISSPLFGTRSVHGSPKVGAIKRLQIRPTYDEKNRLHQLADHFGLPLSELTRIVLHAYFHPGEDGTANSSGTGKGGQSVGS